MRTGVRVLAMAQVSFFANAESQVVTGSFELELEVSSPVSLDVVTGRGEITVREGHSGQVRILGRIEYIDNDWIDDSPQQINGEVVQLIDAFELTPPVTLRNRTLNIGTNDRTLSNHFRINYQITAPSSTDVKVRIARGHTSLQGISGDLTIDAGSGSIALGAAMAALDVDLGRGTVSVIGRPSEPWDLNVGSGEIRIELSDEVPIDVDARAGRGAVYTEHSLLVEGRVQRRSLVGSIRGGGPLISARVGSGDIRIN